MSQALAQLQPWRDAGVFESADVHLAATIARLAGDDHAAVLLAAALAARAPRRGDVCVDLRTVRQQVLADLEGGASSAPDNPRGGDRGGAGARSALPAATGGATATELHWPDPEPWLELLGASPLVAGPDAPLVLEGSLLYLERYHRYEVRLAEQLLRRATAEVPSVDADIAVLDTLLPGDESRRQREAVGRSLAAGLTVLVGGPGTGKTTTVAALVACMQQSLGHQRVALVAPTGKAAARLGEAFRAAAARLPTRLSADLLHQLDTSTVHRLLGVQGESATRFRHDAGHQLPHDVVIVDESSMVSLPLMSKLLDAVRADARVVLVGDPGQLASVDAGTVLADLAGPVVAAGGSASSASSASSPMAACVHVLSVSRRFPPGSTIERLARAIGSGDAESASELLADSSANAASDTASPRPDSTARVTVPLGAGGVVWHRDPEAALDTVRAMVEPAALAMVQAARLGDAAAALAASDRVRVLCALRVGRRGVHRWNEQVESWLAAGGVDTVGWYPGRPVMVTANDYRLGVFNGDLGVVVQVDGVPMVAFPTAGPPRLVAPAQLEHVETVHATTIHKSQGSEFDQVVVVLPPAGSRVASRELLYTAVTRAREQVVVLGATADLADVVARRTVRASGLGQRLWGGERGR